MICYQYLDQEREDIGGLLDLVSYIIHQLWGFELQEAGVSGLQSKTHMKLMLKWMRGRQMLKLICHQVGSNKKFLHCTLPEDPQSVQTISSEELNVQRKKASNKPKAKSKKKSK